MAHTYVIGQSGSGKSTLLKALCLKDIKDGHAVVFIDPHGYDTEELMSLVPRSRLKDTVLFDPTIPLSWNPLQESDNIPLIATAMTDSFRAIWGYDKIATPVLEMMVQSLITSALEKGRTLLSVFYYLNDVSLIPDSDNQVLQSFWDKYTAMKPRDREAIHSSTYNKLYALLLDRRMQKLFGTSKGLFSVSETIKDKLLFVQLPQGQLGLGKTKLLGSLLLTQVHLASLKRDPAIPLSIYIDEVHTFAPSTIAEMLSGLRKFNVNITVAHQYVEQLDKTLFSSLMGNCSERLVFRVSKEDALYFEERLGKYAAHFNLDELKPFRYRRYPHYSVDRDIDVPELPKPTAKNMAERIRKHTLRNYCREG